MASGANVCVWPGEAGLIWVVADRPCPQLVRGAAVPSALHPGVRHQGVAKGYGDSIGDQRKFLAPARRL